MIPAAEISASSRQMIDKLTGNCPPQASDYYFSPDELAARWRITEGSLANIRSRGEGVPWVKLPSGSIRYRLSDVLKAEAAGYKGFTWSRLEDALAMVEGLSKLDRKHLIDHLRKHLC